MTRQLLHTCDRCGVSKLTSEGNSYCTIRPKAWWHIKFEKEDCTCLYCDKCYHSILLFVKAV